MARVCFTSVCAQALERSHGEYESKCVQKYADKAR